MHEGRAERPRLVTTNQALLSMMGYEPISRPMYIPIRGRSLIKRRGVTNFYAGKTEEKCAQITVYVIDRGLGWVSNQCVSYEAGLEIFT